MASNAREILEQFTLQAEGFAATPGMRDPDALDRMLAVAAAAAADVVLDVACGPGIVAAAYARVVRQAIGVDLTPAMLAQAARRQRELGLANLAWVQADALRLPFADASFSIVNSRYALHHCPEPAAMLREMRRVCRPGGRVVVTDAAPAPEKAAAYNRAEKLRDPSHVRAYSLAGLTELFAAAGLPVPRAECYRMSGTIAELLRRSFPLPGDEPRLRELYRDSVRGDPLDMALSLDAGGAMRYGFPVAILAAPRPAA